MKIASVKIQHFKTFDNEGILLSLSDLSTLVGENNAGKSNILEALDLFFNFSKSKISKQCFHHDDVSNDIIIELTFHKLTTEEEKKFKIHLDEKDNTLTITQKIFLKLEEGQELTELDESDYEFEESKHGTKWDAIDEYEWAKYSDKKPTKTNIKNWWKNDLVIDNFNFKSLFENPDVIPSQDEYKMKLEILWDEYFDIIPKQKVTGDEKVLGWKNKLKGNLPKYFYLPAVKHIEEDIKVLKNNAFGEMINWLTNNITEEVRKDFEERTKPIIEEALSQIDQDEDGNSKISFINESLNKNLVINLDCQLEIKFGQPGITDIIFPTPQLFANDGYNSDISLKGQGIQRLAMFSLLRTYNDFKKKTDKYLRNIIIAIEEPEIYLHPPVKRSTYKLLRELSKLKDQIIYSTHDSYFVSVEHFDEIRLFRRIHGAKPKTNVYEFSLENLIKFYKGKYGKDVSEKSLRQRFGHICDESKNEGFFANKIIIIEGDTEKYSLPLYFQHKCFDIDNEKISIISAGSVDNISYLYVIFNEFHIPCYIIFDGDKPTLELSSLQGTQKQDAKNKSRRNKELLQFLSESVNETDEYIFPSTNVKNNYAVWGKNFETTFHKPLENYEEIKSNAKKLFRNDSKPLTGRFFAEVITTDYPDKINKYIDELITNIKQLSWAKSCLNLD